MAETEIPAELEELMADLVKKATVECTLRRHARNRRRRLQVITLGGEMEHDMEVGEMILELIRASNDGNVDMDLEANLEIAAQLTGELLWDPAAGHFASCEMDIEIACSRPWRARPTSRATRWKPARKSKSPAFSAAAPQPR